MRAQTRPPPPIDIDAFLAWEMAQDDAHELIAGEIVPMVGGKNRHYQILFTLAVLLRSALPQGPRRVFIHGPKLVTPLGDMLYPDLIVFPGPVDLDATVNHDASLVAEVLSPSTRGRDTGRKLASYRTVPSMQAVLMLEQDRAAVTLHTRGPDEWSVSTAEGLEARIAVAPLVLDLPLGALYSSG